MYVFAYKTYYFIIYIQIIVIFDENLIKYDSKTTFFR